MFRHRSRSSTTARALLAVLGVALFMWSQHEMQRHSLQHLGEQLRRHHEQGVQTPVADLFCVECSLLAGGSHAIPGSARSLAATAPTPGRITTAFVSRVVAAASYYSSRAPPALL